MTRLASLLLVPLALSACQPKADADEPAVAAAATPPKPDPSSPEGKIATATSAAPAAISAAAAVVDITADMKVVELRAGTNGWTCIVDDPASPNLNPMCLDGPWMAFMDALMKRAVPKVPAEGIAYMLQGGQDASNDDPFAGQPVAGAGWVETGPHLMILPTNPKSLDQMPNDPKSGGPFVMFRGTPYAHLMVPVK